MKTTRPEPAGFTLVEMLIVIAIMAILAAALMPMVRSAQENADASRCQARMKNLHQACMNHLSSTRAFPYADSYEVHHPVYDTYHQRTGWVKWTLANAGRVPENDYLYGHSTEESQADLLCYPVWGDHGEGNTRDPATKITATHARMSILTGSLFPYAGKDMTTYCCPRFERLLPRKYDPVRSYVMNYWFGSRRKNRWDPIELHDLQNASREPSRMGLFAEMYINLSVADQPPGYKATDSRNKGEDALKIKQATAFGADAAWDYDAANGDGRSIYGKNEVPGSPHRKAGRWFGHVVFVDGHVEALEGAGPYGKNESKFTSALQERNSKIGAATD